MVAFVQGHMGDFSGGGVFVFELEAMLEDEARAQGSRIVGERHIAGWLVRMGDGLPRFGVTGTDRLVELPGQLELGPGFDQAWLRDRWHGLLDTAVIIQCVPVGDILWCDEVGSPAVVLWVGSSLLNELDELAYYHRTDRVRRRSQHFRRWLSSRLTEAIEPGGVQIREGVTLRVWAPPTAVGARDTDHLETAFALRELGVPLTIVTLDLGLQARAITSGVAAHLVSERWLLPPEKAPED
jgi:hypothetical protein